MAKYSRGVGFFPLGINGSAVRMWFLAALLTIIFPFGHLNAEISMGKLRLACDLVLGEKGSQSGFLRHIAMILGSNGSLIKRLFQ